MNIVVRRAEINDSQDIFQWRNDELTRQMSHTTEKVEWEDHSKWLEATLKNSKRYLLLCNTVDAKKIAVVRFDIECDKARVSINLSPSFRGLKLAKPCLIKAISHFKKLVNEDVACLEAKIKAENIASRKLFESVGFGLIKEVDSVRCYNLLV